MGFLLASPHGLAWPRFTITWHDGVGGAVQLPELRVPSGIPETELNCAEILRLLTAAMGQEHLHLRYVQPASQGHQGSWV